MITKTPVNYLTSIYRKPKFTGLYTRWDSLWPNKRKYNLIWTLTHRALMISSQSKLDEELKMITNTLSNNWYPLDVINSVMKRKINNFSHIKSKMGAKCLIYIRLPWLGIGSKESAKQISSAVEHCYFASNVRVLFATKPLLPSSRKDVLPLPSYE